MKRFLVIAGAMLVLLVPTALWLGLGITGVLTLFAGFGVIAAVKALAKNEHAAVAVAAVAVALIIGVVAIVAITQPPAPVRISQTDLDAKVAAATAAERARGQAAVAAANADRDLHLRALTIAAQQRDAAEAKAATLQARLRAAPAQVARTEPVGIPAYVAPERAASPAAQWRSYATNTLLVGYAYQTAEVRADCAQPLPQRPIEWRHSTAGSWQNLRDVQSRHLAESEGSKACAG